MSDRSCLCSFHKPATQADLPLSSTQILPLLSFRPRDHLRPWPRASTSPTLHRTLRTSYRGRRTHGRLWRARRSGITWTVRAGLQDQPESGISGRGGREEVTGEGVEGVKGGTRGDQGGRYDAVNNESSAAAAVP